MQLNIRQLAFFIMRGLPLIFVLAGGGRQATAEEAITQGAVVAETRAYRLGVDAGIRWQRGTARELVYMDPFLLSDLTWDIKDLLYAGLTVHLLWGESWHFQASYWGAITEGRGEMTDYDYLIPTIWTHYSDGTVDINRAYQLDLLAAWTFWLQDPVNVQLQWGYRQLYWDWSQYGGNFIYSVDGFRDQRGRFPADQNGINYEQTFYIPYAGIGVQAHWRSLSLTGYAHYTPFAYAESFDEHVLRDLYFEDTFYNVTYYAAGVSLAYELSMRWHISGDWDWHEIPETRGDTVIIDALDRSEERLYDSAGIANRAWSLSVSAGMRF